MAYTTGTHNNQSTVANMSRRKKYKPGKVGEEAGQALREECNTPPEGLSKRERKIWEALNSVDPELDNKLSDAFDKLFWPNNPNKKKQHTAQTACTHG